MNNLKNNFQIPREASYPVYPTRKLNTLLSASRELIYRKIAKLRLEMAGESTIFCDKVLYIFFDAS